MHKPIRGMYNRPALPGLPRSMLQQAHDQTRGVAMLQGNQLAPVRVRIVVRAVPALLGGAPALGGAGGSRLIGVGAE
jgi:hypothetical protein